MKTLYVRIIVIFVIISTVSSLLALLLSNWYYQRKLQTYHEEKAIQTANEIRSLYEAMQTDLELDFYLSKLSSLGYQFYLVGERESGQYEGVYFGDEFKHKQLDEGVVESVLNGEIYRGLLHGNRFFSIAGYFENSLRSSIGIPLSLGNETKALFIRTNLSKQVGEIRLLVAILLLHSFVFTILFMLIATRIIVKPIQELTQATKQIVHGNFDIELDVGRQDEIGNLALHFTQMSESIKQFDQMRQEFVANVSHEIQSPLTTIQGFSHTMLTEQLPPELARRYLQLIEEESRRLSSLSKQLLTLASLDKEQEHLLKRTSFRLDEQIRHIFIVNEWLWAGKQLEIDLQLAEVIVNADRELLYQVWQNLIINAIKFCETGDRIHVSLQIDQHIYVTIQDTGIGIREEDLAHIFERFYKADDSRGSNGSGLGLTIVKEIVKLHQGDIEVRSTLGEGTSFIVRLPHL